jgi:hypothetical protein
MLYLDATINVMLPVATHGHDSSLYIKKLGFTTPVTTSRPMACNRNARRPWWAGPRRRRAAAAGRWVGPAGARPGEERSGWRCAACALGPFGCMQYCNAILRTMVFFCWTNCTLPKIKDGAVHLSLWMNGQLLQICCCAYLVPTHPHLVFFCCDPN